VHYCGSYKVIKLIKYLFTYLISLFQFLLQGVGQCPCGEPDPYDDMLMIDPEHSSSSVTYLSFGTETPMNLTDTLFDRELIGRPRSEGYNFTYDGHDEECPGRTCFYSR